MALISIIVYGDIVKRFPTYEAHGLTTSLLTQYIATAFQDITDRIKEKGHSIEFILEDDSANFRRLHTAKTLCLIYTALMIEEGDMWDVRAKEQCAAYESGMNKVSYRVDKDGDDEPDEVFPRTRGVVRITR